MNTTERRYKGHVLREPEHKPICEEYRDRGLKCPCVTISEQMAIIEYKLTGDASWLDGIGP